MGIPLRQFAPRRPAPTQWLGLAVVAGGALLSDQLTKELVAARLAVGTTVEAVGPLWFTHTDNPGFALGVASGQTWLVPTASAVVILAAVAYFARLRSHRASVFVALGLIVGGSAANLIDRVRIGHVTDLAGIHFSPAFNLADVFIAVGLAVLALEFGRDQHQRHGLSFGR